MDPRACLMIVAVLLNRATAIAAPAVAPTAAPADLSQLLAPIRNSNHEIPAMWGCVVEERGPVAIAAVGVRKADLPIAATAGDQIHLGSDTKAMTAVLIGQQIEAGRLSLGTTMAQVFPKLRSNMNPAMAAVTVAQLLQHRAGLPHDLDWSSFSSAGSLVAQRKAAAERALSAKPLFPPGSEFQYSNVGYVMLGAVLERQTGQSWEQLIQARLFQPLGMTTAGFGPPGTPGKVDQPWGHTLPFGFPLAIQADNPPIMGPAGRVHCSIGDWARFITLFLQPARPSTILRDAALTALLTSAPGGDYAGGWVLTQRQWAGGLTLVHAGSNSMWYCVAWVAPKRHFAVLVATNVAGEAGVMQSCDDAATALIRWHETHPAPPEGAP